MMIEIFPIDLESPVARAIEHFTIVIHTSVSQTSVFFTVTHFHPSLIFTFNARAYPKLCHSKGRLLICSQILDKSGNVSS
jgi:hypothetical protein